MTDDLVRLVEGCPRCELDVSGVGIDEAQATQRLRNNMRLHRGGKRCAQRAFAQKRATS